MSSDIVYALWRKPLNLQANALSIDEEDHLERICHALSLHFFRLYRKQAHQYLEDHSLSRLLKRALRASSAKWCVVFSSGTLLGEGFFNEVQHLCQETLPTTLLRGHILDRKQRGFGLHPQFFILNLDLWQKINCPKFGTSNAEHVTEIYLPLRSKENIHSDYTPLWIHEIQKTSLQKPSVFGWNIINLGLTHGLRFENLPEKLRNQKRFLYPEENSRALLQSLISLPANSQTNLPKNLSQNQRALLDLLELERPFSEPKIFPFNTESYLDIVSNKYKQRLDCLYSVASGFKDLFILREHGFHEKTKLVFFDLNKKALFFKKYLYRYWNGFDFPSFYSHLLDHLPSELSQARLVVSRKEALSLWEKEISSWGGEVSFQEHFLAVQKLEKEFHHVDLVQDPWFIANHLLNEESQSIAIWHSNCFNYTPSVIAANWDLQFLQNRSRKYINSLSTSSLDSKDISLYGEDVFHGYKCYTSGNNLKELFY